MDNFISLRSMKACSACSVMKDMSEFWKNAGLKDGLQGKCKSCAKSYVQDRQEHYNQLQQNYRDKNRTLVRERDRAAYWKDPEATRLKKRLNYALHADQIHKRERRWRNANPDKIKKARQNYARKHPLKMRLIWRKSGRLRENAVGLKYTTEQHVQWRFQMWGDKCYLCGQEATTIDHVIPLSRGGTHFPSNLRPACLPCNSSKSGKTLSEYLQYLKEAA